MNLFIIYTYYSIKYIIYYELPKYNNYIRKFTTYNHIIFINN